MNEMTWKIAMVFQEELAEHIFSSQSCFASSNQTEVWLILTHDTSLVAFILLSLICHCFLQKYAVRTEEGKRHPVHLEEEIPIQNKHPAQLQKECDFPIQESILQAHHHCSNKKVQIEIDSVEKFQQTFVAKPNVILLGTMSPQEEGEVIPSYPKGVYLETSDGIDLTNIRSYIETDVHGISIGRLNHSINAVDMSLKI